MFIDSSLSSLLKALLISLLVATILSRVRRRRTGYQLPLPPGPKRPWFGFVELPKVRPWLVYADWKQDYGDFFYVRVLGNPILVVNSARVAKDLLQTRGSNYSSRPVRTMTFDLMGWGFLFSSMPYDSWWRRHRSLFHQYFNVKKVPSYQPYQLRGARQLLRDLLTTPDRFEKHVRKSQAAMVLDLTYGHQANEDDSLLTLVDSALLSLSKAGLYGTYLVDYLPFLKHVPAWFPGAGFRRQAREWRKLSTAMVNDPFDVVKRNMEKGCAAPCIVTRELEALADTASTSNEGETVVKNVAAIVYAAGADTTSIAILTMILAMILYPEVQRKAQAEIDRVVGSSRLPTFEDGHCLVYNRCIVLESLRYHSASPLGLVHTSTHDDEYRGYRIPRGTSVIPNIWQMLHDPDVYPDPMEFKPERFMDRESNRATGLNPDPDAAFGFGRRICPGRWMAKNSIFIVAASLLAAYDILPALDEQGKPILPTPVFMSGLLSRPEPFSCRFRPRSERARELILEDLTDE